ncbi:LIM/homeobox protein Lhx5 [Trichoplax sp. H2]|nr:LIM/homeobox protein Lhx5 [Trichoplax sp. H2]|eukprot:RDD47472.1 LIM/homeobox protein Lhx5 [Trichoplax sp. H2]
MKTYGTKCSGCGIGISPNELVRRARDDVYHIKCLKCAICGRQMSTGEQLYINQHNQYICQVDYQNSISSTNTSLNDQSLTSKSKEDTGALRNSINYL